MNTLYLRRAGSFSYDTILINYHDFDVDLGGALLALHDLPLEDGIHVIEETSGEPGEHSSSSTDEYTIIEVLPDIDG